MLAERRRATDLRVIPAEELVGHRERLEFADAGIVEAADELARAHVRIAEDLGDIVYRPDGYIERIQLCNQVRAGKRRYFFGEHAHHFVAPLDPGDVLREGGAPLLDAERLAERRPVLIAGRDVRVASVLAAEGRGRHAAEAG